MDFLWGVYPTPWGVYPQRLDVHCGVPPYGNVPVSPWAITFRRAGISHVPEMPSKNHRFHCLPWVLLYFLDLEHICPWSVPAEGA